MDKQLLSHLENLEKSLPWLNDRTILLAPTGSHAYGTATVDSDKDYKGVCIPPKDYFLGLNSFNEYNSAGGKNFKNTKDDIDVNILHINKFVADAMSGVPNNIEILFVRPKDYLKVTELGQELIDNRHLFLTKQIQKKFGGYALSQMKRMRRNNSNGAGRVDLIDKYGYDVKFFMHAVRLLTSAIEILETGTFSTYRPNKNYLVECREGKYSLDEAEKVVELLDKEMMEAYRKSTLPETPDVKRINEFLIGLNEKALQ